MVLLLRFLYSIVLNLLYMNIGHRNIHRFQRHSHRSIYLIDLLVLYRINFFNFAITILHINLVLILQRGTFVFLPSLLCLADTFHFAVIFVSLPPILLCGHFSLIDRKNCPQSRGSRF
jgi:hypothetical protein